MENSWQRKCGSMWQLSLPAPVVASSSYDSHVQFSNADCYLYLQPPQESMSLARGVAQDHMAPNMLPLDSIGHADLGASFLSLLSGPSAHVPSNLQPLLEPKPVPSSSQVPLNHRTANGFSVGSRVSVLPGALWQQNMDSQNLMSGEVFFPLISSNSTVNCSNSSAVHLGTNINFQKSEAVACQNLHEKDKVKSFSSLIGNNNAGPISSNSWKLQKYVDATSLQKVPVESNFSACHHGHNPSGSFPRVFCSGISGNLLLSDTGLLGVVCTCHGLYMSISKFSEHSGSCDANPGNAVCMENGETVAHWWNSFFPKSGIRVLEGLRGWDWPEGISATSCLTNCPISNMSSNSVRSNQVGSLKTSVSYGRQQYNMINSKENQSYRNIIDQIPYHEKDITSQESSNSFIKYLINSSQGDLRHEADQQIWGMPNSFGINTEKATQSTAAKLDSIFGSANSLPALSNIQDLKMPCNGFSASGNTSFIVEEPGVFSNIELRLGQPPELSHTLETKVLPAFGSNLNGVHAEPPKVFFSEKLPQKIGNGLQGSMWTLQYSDIASKNTDRRGPTQLECSSHMGGAYGANWRFQNTYDNGSDSHFISEKLHHESYASRSEKMCYPWSAVVSNSKEFDTNLSTAQNQMNKGKEVECSVNGLLGAAKPSIEFSKTLKEDLSTFNAILRESSNNYSPSFYERSPNLYQMSAMIADESDGRGILNNCWKISSVSDIRLFNPDHVKPNPNSINTKDTASMDFTSKNSVFVQGATPILSKEKCSGTNPCLQDENTKIPVVQNLLELSNRDDGPASVRDIRESETESLLTVAPSTSKDHVHLLDSLRMSKIPDVGEKLTLPCAICWMGHNSERFGNMSGRSLCTEDCDLPPVERLFVRPGGIECNFTRSKKDKFSQGLSYAYVPEKCSCAVQANCLTGKYDLNGDNTCLNFVKEGDRSEAATSLLHSKLNDNCIFLKERAKSSEKTETVVATNIKRAESHFFQWRDVPKKIMESCSSTSKEQQADSFNAPFRSPAADVAKCFTGFARNVAPLKEHELSNISSGCSAPDVTQSSIEVNKKDSSNIEGRDIKYANSLVLDEGSGNDRSWSCDDAPNNEHCAEFLGSAARISLINRGPLKIVPKRSPLSLIEEIRLQNSLRSKNAEYQTKRSSTIQEESDHLQKFVVGSKKRRKTVKWMKLDAPFPVSGQSSVNNESPKCTEEVGQNAHSFWDIRTPVGCDEGRPSNSADSVERRFKQRNSAFSTAKRISFKRDFHRVCHQGEQQATEAQKSSGVDDPSEASEMFRKKKLRLADASAMSKEIREAFCSSAELTAKLSSLGCPSSSPGNPNSYKWMARPVVFGKYGIISNGNPSKPTKIVPLRNILKIAASCSEKSNRNATSDYDSGKLKSPSVKVKKISVRHVKGMSLSKKVLKNQVKEGGTHDLVPVELEPHHLNGETETPSWLATNGSDNLSYTLQKCNNHGIAYGKPGIQLKTKFKEGRKRSLHELLIKGNGFKVVNSSVLKNSLSLCQTTEKCWGKLMEDAAGGKVQTNEMNNAKRCSEKHQPANSDTFCCVCGSSDKDGCNQLLECNRFLIKGLRSEAEADDENVSLYGRCMLHATSCMCIPDGGGESLQPEENSWTCARTEGYKGRKREGFLHNHPQDANGNAGCLVPQEQLNAWLHIHRQKPQRKGRPKLSSSKVESDCRKAYARYKQSKGWKHLVVYKSGIHALGLYTSQFISRGAMVVEYVGEIVGLRVADRRESEYHSGKKLQHKSACYFFRIDKEHIIDATRKGGIARFVNHSCQPNCVAKVISVRNEKKVVFFAERDIYPGEEITYDYHFNHEDEGEKIPCYCKSKNCRRFLN